MADEDIQTGKKVPKKKAAKKSTSKKAVTKKAATKKKVVAATSVSDSAPSKKMVAKKAAARKVAKKAATKPAQTLTGNKASAEERYKMIQTAAYYRAEKHGFTAGKELEDWAGAEKEIDAMLRSQGRL